MAQILQRALGKPAQYANDTHKAMRHQGLPGAKTLRIASGFGTQSASV